MRATMFLFAAACTIPGSQPAPQPPATATPRATTPSPAQPQQTTLPPFDDPSTRECAIVDKAIRTWSLIQEAYDALLPQAIAGDWRSSTYDAEVGKYVAQHSGGDLGTSGVGAQTNMCSCVTVDIEKLCAQDAAQGLPPVICDASKAHEATHRQQCEHNKTLPAGTPDGWTCNPDGSYSIPPKLRDRDEHAAYDVVLKTLDAYAAAHCPKGCAQLAKATSWTGSIQIRFLRTNLTNYTEERMEGGASYTSKLTKPQAEIGVNGYDRLWMGPARGEMHFDDVERQLSGERPYEGHASGALLSDPHLTDFGPEILRIDDKNCRYAFETFAAVDSTWNRNHDQHPESVHVQLGGMTIAKKDVRTLTGSQTLALPISHFDWPGPAVRLPNDPIDWKARGKIGGSVTITWTFWPTK